MAPVECPSGETHVWGMAGTRAVDFSLPGGGGGGSSVGGQWLDYASMFGPGGILVFDAPEGIDGPRRGFMRAELGGAARVLCVQSLVDSSEEHLDRFTLEVVELGACDAGASVSGEVTACL
ncbi:MAG: hypothetical protein R3B07_13925 [Polyangiaceae bacterium]